MNEVIEKKIHKDNDRGWRRREDDLKDIQKEQDWTYNMIPWED